jgi:hypothetical protein
MTEGMKLLRKMLYCRRLCVLWQFYLNKFCRFASLKASLCDELNLTTGRKLKTDISFKAKLNTRSYTYLPYNSLNIPKNHEREAHF